MSVKNDVVSDARNVLEKENCILKSKYTVEKNDKNKGLVVIAIALLVFVMIGLRSVVVPGSLGNINRNYFNPETGSADISFNAQEGAKIKFSFTSNVQSGELDMVLYDSEDKVVYELDKAKESETFYTIEQADTYTLRAEYNEFTGNFKVVVYHVD